MLMHYELCDGTICDAELLYNGLCGELTVARVHLSDGSTLPGSLLLRRDYLYLLAQYKARSELPDEDGQSRWMMP